MPACGQSWSTPLCNAVVAFEILSRWCVRGMYWMAYPQVLQASKLHLPETLE